MLFDELFDAFMHSRKHGLAGAKCVNRAATLENYDRCLKYFVNFVREKGRARYADMTRNDVRAYIEHVNSREDWSPATKLTYLRALRTLFRFVDADEECAEQKLRSWGHLLPKIPKNPRRDFIPTPKDLRRTRLLFDTSKLFGLRNYIVYNLILGCGLRIGEICWLRLEHLQLDQKLIYVPKEGKTGSRIVPIEEKLVNLLKTWLRRRATITGVSDVPWVFLGRGGVQCNKNTFGKAFRKAQPGRGPKNRITAHTLRHCFGTYYLRNGGNLERLRQIMGHSTYDTLRGYLHLAEVGSEQAKEELERVSPLKMVNTTA